MVNQHSVATETEDETAGEIANVWEVLGRRWSMLILKNLCTKEVIRFNEFKTLLPGISSTVLADRLSELEREGLVSKKIYPEIPPKVGYRLTLRAEELRVIFKKLGLAGLQPKQNPELLPDQLARATNIIIY
ncbi:MAG: transcriptional regulator [Candidatus Nitrosopolaris wilkensis]|nr:MAG: transcriptional regulator [Candidatus Nitrosopolaris wilkensis]